MTESNWVSGPPPGMPSPPPSRRPRGRTGIAVLSAVGGIAAGVAIAWGVVGANAATTTGTGSTTSSAAVSSSTSSAAAGADGHGHSGGVGTTGTVTAVGSSSVTIKTSSGTTTYKVSSVSDIDKNGEAKLSDLKVGDAVRFDTTTSGSTVIDHLHAGKESLDRPSH